MPAGTTEAGHGLGPNLNGGGGAPTRLGTTEQEKRKIKRKKGRKMACPFLIFSRSDGSVPERLPPGSAEYEAEGKMKKKGR
ncbi:MAG: hypothetical protein D6679_05955 [Candidatus Hydrogenedentota bacterium]|nr:MAG: hypothetical protein D6679_05955 [Candidatus Hydrogenedentota bacterium]